MCNRTWWRGHAHGGVVLTGRVVNKTGPARRPVIPVKRAINVDTAENEE